MKTGLFGGTFDPPHLAHLAVAESALSFASLDRVIWIPAAVPPHRSRPTASGGQRLEMVEIAIADHNEFEASEIELRRDGKSYTVDTIDRVREMYVDDDLFLIIGGDSLRSFDTWREPERILDSVRLIVYDRDEQGYDDVDPQILKSALVIPEAPLLDVSSSEIRNRVAEGRSIDHLVPELVAEYIRSRGLYRQVASGK